jgi:dTDP-glucose pyrophosphorylase
MHRSGDEFGVRLQYTVQEKPEGLAQAFILFITHDGS